MDEVNNEEFIFVKDVELEKKGVSLREEFGIKYPEYGLEINRIDSGALHICYEKLDNTDIEAAELKEMQIFLGILLEKYKVI